jgi:NADPH-dependent 2,4-dienoyl-CoA reductase/sulfur reductase-like enzyme
MSSKRIVIIGGVAGGASAAARARRLSEEAEIIVFERGPHVSFANCGLPYYVGGEIREESQLLLQTPESLRARFNLDVRVRSEVVSIDRKRKRITVRELTTGREYEEAFDALILARVPRPLCLRCPGLSVRALHGAQYPRCGANHEVVASGCVSERGCGRRRVYRPGNGRATWKRGLA